MKVKLLSYTGQELFLAELEPRFKFMNFLKKAEESGVNMEEADILSTIENINKEFKVDIKSYLLVDDNESLLNANSRLISRRGHYVKTFADPEDAKDFFNEDPDFFDIIILDNHMPGILGNDLARDMCDQTTKSKVYMLTGYGNEVDVHHEHQVYIMHKGKENFQELVPAIKLQDNSVPSELSTGTDQDGQTDSGKAA